VCILPCNVAIDKICDEMKLFRVSEKKHTKFKTKDIAEISWWDSNSVDVNILLPLEPFETITKYTPLRVGYNHDSTAIRQPFDCLSTVIRVLVT